MNMRVGRVDLPGSSNLELNVSELPAWTQQDGEGSWS